MAAHPPTHIGEYMSENIDEPSLSPDDQGEGDGKQIPVLDTPIRYWQNQSYEPTAKDKTEWLEEGLPPDDEIVAGFLMNNPLIWGVPNKKEIFRLADLTTESDRGYGENKDLLDGYMLLRTVTVPLPLLTYELAHPPLGGFHGITEHNYNLRLSVVSVDMLLHHIKVLHGDRRTKTPKIVFEGTDYPGPSARRRVRVIRVTVHEEGYATHEVVSETTYPKTAF